MAYDLIPILLLIGSLVGLAIIIGRKFPQMKTLDVDSIPAERELRLKQRLLASRLRRHLEAFGRILATVVRPAVLGLLRWLKRGYRRILELESRYQRPAKVVHPAGPLPTVLDELLVEARRLQASGETSAAEERLMKLIGLDPRHVAAYELLGEIYLGSRDYPQAREVYGYLIKLLRRGKRGAGDQPQRLAASYLNLATVHLGLGRQVQALQYARKAVTLAPSNPRVLDFLLKISIVVKDKALADKTWLALQQADPGNAKLPELKQQIDQLP